MRGGRCSACGAALDLAAVSRRERHRERLRRSVGDVFDWAEVLPGPVIVGLVLASVLPVWTIGIAVLLSLRPIVRLLVRGADSFVDST
jgi:hypothetical protein